MVTRRDDEATNEEDFQQQAPAGRPTMTTSGATPTVAFSASSPTRSCTLIFPARPSRRTGTPLPPRRPELPVKGNPSCACDKPVPERDKGDVVARLASEALVAPDPIDRVEPGHVLQKRSGRRDPVDLSTHPARDARVERT